MYSQMRRSIMKLRRVRIYINEFGFYNSDKRMRTEAIDSHIDE